MHEERSFHMTAEEFRRHGREVVDWIADYWERVESLPVLSKARPGEIRAALPPSAPATGEPFEAILRDVDDRDPARRHALAVAQLLRLLPGQRLRPLDPRRAALRRPRACRACCGPPARRAPSSRPTSWTGWRRCSACRRAFTSDGTGGGVIQDTASSAALCALLAARERATGLRQQRARLRRPPRRLRLHPGPLLGREGGQDRRSRPRATCGSSTWTRPSPCAPRRWRAGSPQDRAAGLRAVSSSAPRWAPPRPTPSTRCPRSGGSAGRRGSGCTWTRRCPARPRSARSSGYIHDGVELADSYCFNPHKWMFTNFDCDCFCVADRAALIRALSILPEYLQNKATESGRGHRLPRLAHPARPAVPVAEALVRDPLTTASTASSTTSGGTSSWPRSSPAGSRSRTTSSSRCRPPSTSCASGTWAVMS